MFSELGLNVARHTDNAANPRPDNRSGWLDGETPDIVEAYLDTREHAETRSHAPIEFKLRDPASQLRVKRKQAVMPRPDGAPNRWPGEAPSGQVPASGMPFRLLGHRRRNQRA